MICTCIYQQTADQPAKRAGSHTLTTSRPSIFPILTSLFFTLNHGSASSRATVEKDATLQITAPCHIRQDSTCKVISPPSSSSAPPQTPISQTPNRRRSTERRNHPASLVTPLPSGSPPVRLCFLPFFSSLWETPKGRIEPPAQPPLTPGSPLPNQEAGKLSRLLNHQHHPSRGFDTTHRLKTKTNQQRAAHKVDSASHNSPARG